MQMFSRLFMSGLMAVSLLSPVIVMAQPDLGTRDIGVEQETGLGSGDIRITIARMIRILMGLLGIIAVVIIMYGGFTWMTAGGNDERVGEAKKWIMSGVIGLAIILSSFAIASFVINSLVNATVLGDGDI